MNFPDNEILFLISSTGYDKQIKIPKKDTNESPLFLIYNYKLNVFV